MDFEQIFTWYFWAYKATPMQGSTMLNMAIVFVAAILLGIIIRMLSNNSRYTSLQKGQLRVFVQPLITFGFLELLFLWMHYERVPYFSRRISFLFIFIAMIYWVALRGRQAYKILPEKYSNHTNTNDRDKYLPHNGQAS